jgi:putative nucleotide binding protein
LLELVPKKDIFLQPYEEVYIGDGKREKIHHVNGRIPVSKLTGTANSELEHVVEQLVEEDETRFVDFFNSAQPLSTRMHALELLPGVGKKHMREILEVRREQEFESLDDINTRVKLLPNPKKLIVRRIMSELNGDEKHFLFVAR